MGIIEMKRCHFSMKFLLGFFLLNSLSLAPLFAEESKPKQPNIIFIMVNDVGWGDLGSYGGGENRGTPTPNLDKMAAEGMRFTNYYGEASSTAARAAFLTGRIPLRTGLSVSLSFNDKNGIKPEDPTFAEALKDLGYQTAQWGQWHLGDQEENLPIRHGFDEMHSTLFYPASAYAYDYPPLQPDFPIKNERIMDFWNHLKLNLWEGKVGNPPKIMKQKFGYDDLATIDLMMTQGAVGYIQKHAHDPQPFFMYVCFMKAHSPNNPAPPFKGKSLAGSDYYDALLELDFNLGKIIQTVRNNGIAENTIIVWVSDNGPWLDAAPDAGYTPFRGEKGTSFEGGFRCPALAWWPGHIKSGMKANELMSHLDWWPTIIKIVGGEPPPRIWRDRNGKGIIFDGIDNSDYLLGRGASNRDHFIYTRDLNFEGIRVANYKILYTAKDTWLGPELNLQYPAIYNLWWDPNELYDMTYNGATPTRGDLKTSPGRFTGSDHEWVGVFATPHVERYFEELNKFPNRPTQPSMRTIFRLIREAKE